MTQSTPTRTNKTQKTQNLKGKGLLRAWGGKAEEQNDLFSFPLQGVRPDVVNKNLEAEKTSKPLVKHMIYISSLIQITGQAYLLHMHKNKKRCGRWLLAG